MRHYRMYINGEWRDSKETKPVYDKYTGQQVATYAVTSIDEVNEAVAAAKRSFEEVKLPPAQRAEILVKAAQYIVEDYEEMAQLICEEAGRLIGDSRGEATRSKGAFELSAEEGCRICGEMVPVDGMAGAENKMCFTVRIPVGVVCAITPFNVPLSLTVHKVAPAIAAGNTVVLKPTSETPGFAVKLVEALLKAGLPKNHIQLVLGGGATVGEALLKNQDVNFYTFTGSKETGEHIRNTVGLRRSTMELGSNAPVIIHKDAKNIRAIAANCCGKGFANAGQVCMKPQRLYVHEDVYEEFMAAAVEFANSLKVGDPKDPATKIGPMISTKNVDRVDAWIHEAVEQGAVIAVGGKKVGERCYAPTILTNVKKGMKVVDSEIFGPVVVVIRYTDFEDAIRQANDSIYGLQAGVFTSDFNNAMKAVREVQAGGVIINETSFTRVDSMPYGGIKNSSVGGKEGPKYVIEEMTDVKTILIQL